MKKFTSLVLDMNRLDRQTGLQSRNLNKAIKETDNFVDRLKKEGYDVVPIGICGTYRGVPINLTVSKVDLNINLLEVLSQQMNDFAHYSYPNEYPHRYRAKVNLPEWRAAIKEAKSLCGVESKGVKGYEDFTEMRDYTYENMRDILITSRDSSSTTMGWLMKIDNCHDRLLHRDRHFNQTYTIKISKIVKSGLVVRRQDYGVDLLISPELLSQINSSRSSG